MNNKILPIFLVSCIIVCLQLMNYFELETGNEQNTLSDGIPIDRLLKLPETNIIRPNSELKVLSPKYKILYSLDGGLTFFNSHQRLGLNNIRNTSIIHVPNSIRWRSPYGELPEILSLVVKLVDEKKMTESKKAVYTFLNENTSKGKIVSLSIKNSDLLDELSGIMVLGQSSWNDVGFYKDWWYRSANFSKRGLEWEREVFFTYIEDGKKVFEQNCAIRITGNATRYYPQKSLRLYAKKMYGGSTFEFPFWGSDGIKNSESIVLRNGGNDNSRTLFADLLMHKLSKDANVLTLKGEPVSLFINGNYWGIYELRERIDTKFIAEKTGSKKGSVTILDAPHGLLKDGSTEMALDFKLFIEKLKMNLEMKVVSTEYISEFINVNSFTDYVVLESYFSNPDWPENNCTWYCTDDVKWSWILYDMDLALGFDSENIQRNIFDRLLLGDSPVCIIFKSMLMDPVYKKHFVERANELVCQISDSEFIAQNVDEIFEFYNENIIYEIRRWRNIESEEKWLLDCEDNISFLKNRKPIYLEQLKQLE